MNSNLKKKGGPSLITFLNSFFPLNTNPKFGGEKVGVGEETHTKFENKLTVK